MARRMKDLTEDQILVTTVHVKGVENNIADMMSRHPVGGEQHMEIEAWTKSARRGTSEAGWRAITGYTRDYPSVKDIEEAEDREDKITTKVKDALGTLKSGLVSEIGPKVFTWTRLQEETASSMEEEI